MRSRPRRNGPHYLRDELLGRDAWGALVARRGGRDYAVPPRLDCPRGRQLAEWIGAPAAERLLALAAGTVIYVHGGSREILAARRAEMRAMRARGLTVAEIASIEWVQRYSARQVCRMIATDEE